MSRLAVLRHALLFVFADVRMRALLAGVLLGTVVEALAAQRPGNGFALAMALTVVVSGAISFVLHALASSGMAIRHADAGRVSAQVRGWLMLLGLGLLTGMHGPALLGA